MMRRNTIPHGAPTIGLAMAGFVLLVIPTGLSAKPGPSGEESSGFQQTPQVIQPPSRDKTYVEDTSEPRQLEADKIFQQANRAFEKRQLDDALRLYRRAHMLWPHPIILFNMAINLNFMSNDLEAAEMFRRVLEFKPGPISSERYHEASQHYRRLMKRLSTLQVECSEAGAEVFVDGKVAGEGPITKTLILNPGKHLVTAWLKAKVPYSMEVTLKPGYHGELKVALQAFVDVVKTRIVPRYHWALPTVATVLAAVAVGAGAGMWASGRDSITDLRNDQLKALNDTGNYPIQYDKSDESLAKNLQIGGQVLVGVAVTAAVAAVVLWAARKKRESITVEMKSTGPSGGVSLAF